MRPAYELSRANRGTTGDYGSVVHRKLTATPWRTSGSVREGGCMPLVDRHPQLTRPDGSPLRVLVVDDEPNIAELLRMALRYEGWDVEVALTGSKAVSTAKATKPDAVVLDMMLPDFDGMEVLSRLRAAAIRRTRPLPHRPRLRRGPRGGPHGRRRRLRHQAVQPGGGGRPAARADASLRRAPTTRPATC